MSALVNRVEARLRGVDRLGVAFSGGVDSSVLLAIAVRTLGPARVIPILAVSPSLAGGERLAAHEVAAFIGVSVHEVRTAEGDRPAYVANGPDRCWHCKDELFTVIHEDVVGRFGLSAIAYGENADDARRPDRPGAVAAVEHHILRPLADAGLGKAQVRAIALDLRLPCADKSAAPCLASRIPHFQDVTPEKLDQIDRAESALRALGYRDLRVRHHGPLGRVEFGPDDLGLAREAPGPVLAAVRAAGFASAEIDPAGLQSGAFTLTALAATT